VTGWKSLIKVSHPVKVYEKANRKWVVSIDNNPVSEMKPHTFAGHDLDRLGSRDVIYHVTIGLTIYVFL